MTIGNHSIRHEYLSLFLLKLSIAVFGRSMASTVTLLGFVVARADFVRNSSSVRSLKSAISPRSRAAPAMTAAVRLVCVSLRLVLALEGVECLMR